MVIGGDMDSDSELGHISAKDGGAQVRPWLREDG